MNYTNEEKRKWGITPYVTKKGEFVATQIGWHGHCSACGQEMAITEGIDRPDAALIVGHSYRVLESSYDEHPCKAQPYRLKRPYDKRYDMAHPMTDAHFIPDNFSELYRAGTR